MPQMTGHDLLNLVAAGSRAMSIENEFIETLEQFVALFRRLLIEDFVKFAQQRGLSMPQTTVLFHLYYNGPCEVANVKRYIFGDAVADNQIVDRLAQHGLVERKTNPADRRVRMVHLTQQGEELVQASVGTRRQWISELAAKFSGEEQTLITRSISLLAERNGREV
jgi:DNA-binding MarR family transcriptional regulator